jgi:hypothetical protein
MQQLRYHFCFIVIRNLDHVVTPSAIYSKDSRFFEVSADQQLMATLEEEQAARLN